MSEKSNYGKLRFCPKCGVEGLERDFFPDGPPRPNVRTHSPKNGVEYVCEVCGFGFIVAKSRRVMSAEVNAKDMRSKRPPVQFSERSVGSDVANEFLRTEGERKRSC